MCRFDRTAYYTAYRQVYRQDYQTVYKCCPGWSQLNGEAGCLYRKCHEMLKFIIYEITLLHQTEYGNVYSKGSVSSPDSAGARGGGFKHHLTLDTDPLNERFSGTGQKRLRGALPMQTSLQMLSVSAVSTVRVLLQQTHNV